MLRKIPGWLSEREGKLLAYFSSKVPSNGVIVEVGSFQGKSTIYMAKNTQAKIYAVDPHILKSYSKFLVNTKKYKNVIPVKKTSAQANKNWKQKIDLLHIDGNHEYKYAKQDLDLWLPHLKNNGVIVCHDAFTPFPHVYNAIKKTILKNKNFGYLGTCDSQIFAIKNSSNNFQRKFTILASEIWHQENIPLIIRNFIVKRVLKPFYLNRHNFPVILKLWTKN